MSMRSAPMGMSCAAGSAIFVIGTWEVSDAMGGESGGGRGVEPGRW